VEAVVWPMIEAEGLLLDRSPSLFEHETALEQGWLLAKTERRFGLGDGLDCAPGPDRPVGRPCRIPRSRIPAAGSQPFRDVHCPL